MAVIGGNVGLAVAMTILLTQRVATGRYVGRAQRHKQPTELRRRRSRADQWSGRFLLPTTWPVPPLVKRVATALELTVFLALAALVAAFSTALCADERAAWASLPEC
jgi:hypothetical protein